MSLQAKTMPASSSASISRLTGIIGQFKHGLSGLLRASIGVSDHCDRLISDCLSDLEVLRVDGQLFAKASMLADEISAERGVLIAARDNFKASTGDLRSKVIGLPAEVRGDVLLEEISDDAHPIVVASRLLAAVNRFLEAIGSGAGADLLVSTMEAVRLKIEELLAHVASVDATGDYYARLRDKYDRLLLSGSMEDGLNLLAESAVSVIEIGAQESQKVECYLQGLNKQLSGFLGELSDVTAYERSAGNVARAHSDDLLQALGGFGEDSCRAASLADLKALVAERVLCIERSVDKLKESEAKKSTEIQAKLEQLKEEVAVTRAEQEAMQRELVTQKASAETDELTGLPNRKVYNQGLRELLNDYKRKGAPGSLVMVDIDHFKKLNDSYGHKAGDQVLRQFADIARNKVRDLDMLVRYGGEEFAVICRKTNTLMGINVAVRLRKAIEEAVFVVEGGRTLKITASLGVAELQNNDDLSDLFLKADKALYHSKHNGRNSVSYYVQQSTDIDDAANYETVKTDAS